jgi:hypothetical protein
MVSRLYEHKPRVVDAICVGIHPMLECGLPSTITTRQDFSLFLTFDSTLAWQREEILMLLQAETPQKHVRIQGTVGFSQTNKQNKNESMQTKDNRKPM